ncbi:pyridoxamine 5'-phosphate oxidase family protein [Virgibacillus sp. C22-A2]|uniref:Pyridoxamine 5'-phosphate oxidase family protein n=1 Tax=Virgibacillus tibetensis TaxID=3042313 RepID=A0ABU6KF59_9BACI|nr:pyridoxamine 5'-phosphate oxidase family protein [Virgibacillus sp. C22-A2]
MSQQAIKDKVEKILDTDHVGTMATVENKKPHSRYMTFYHKDLKLYTATSKDTHKAEELEQNPYTHILIGYEGEGYGDLYVEYEGKVSFNNSDELKKQLWNKHMEPYFEGPEDPDFVILEIEPMMIRLMNKKGETPETLKL